MSLTPPLWRSTKADKADLTRLRPSAWNALVDLVTRVLDGADVHGSVFVRDTGSVNGASWVADVAAGSYFRSGGLVTKPGWSTLVLPNSAVEGDTVVATGPNTWGAVAAGAAGKVYRGTGAASVPAWSTAGYPDVATPVGAYLRADGTDWVASALLLPNAAAKGDLLVATAVNTIGSLPDVAVGSVLTSGGVGEVPQWSASLALGGIVVTTVDAIATTSTDGSVLQNTTPATALVPVQMAPRLRFRGNVWNTTSGASNTSGWWIEDLPVSGAAPAGQLRFANSANGGAATYPLTIAVGQISIVASLAIATGWAINWTGRLVLNTPAAGQLTLQAVVNSAGAGFDFATDGIIKVRTRTQNADASLTALNVTASSAIVHRIKAGTPTDADVTGPADGMCVVDTAASKIWVRIGGAWKSATVAAP